MSQAPHAVVAEFRGPRDAAAAWRRLRETGLSRIEAFTPEPLLPQSNGARPVGWRLKAIVLAGGLLGAIGGLLVQYLPAVHLYPVNVGGRPLASWPAFLPIAFEIAALSAVLAGVAGFLFLCRLPSYYRPVFRSMNFERASQDRLFLSVETADPRFDRDLVLKLLAEQGAVTLTEVPP